MIALPFMLAFASAVAPTTTIAAANEPPWTVQEQLQVPAMTANHVVGGLLRHRGQLRRERLRPKQGFQLGHARGGHGVLVLGQEIETEVQ